ncbi:MAG TPA: M14 family metallopeptidase, partial [Fimbriiglobus sp.]|nr:M14 family metallopeptidase [Fimbriiglobus sp.]
RTDLRIPPGPDVTFSPDYFAARDRFRSAAARLVWAVHTHPIAARGPGDEELTLDAAVSSPAGREPLLVTSSGVHGVEGPFGSAVQVAALEEWGRTGPPAGVRCVFLHAVNPFGFAHRRRFDEGNVDLNRNFLPAGEKFAGGSPTYAALDPVLNPRRPPSPWDWFEPRAVAAILRYGYEPIKQAVAGGQYEYPNGLFFGGHGPSASQLILREHFPGWLSDALAVAHIDFHTGLGRWATYKLLAEVAFSPTAVARVERWFGRGVYEPSEPRGVAYRTRGGFGHWCPEAADGRDYLFLVAEFGTYPILRVLAGLRAENQAHHWGRPADPGTRRAKARLLELFCPASPRWRARVREQGVTLIRQAVAGLRGGAGS